MDCCDDPYQPYELTNTHDLIKTIENQPHVSKGNGYYPLKNNVFHQLEFCHWHGLNGSTPVEPLHCVMLGLFICLLQGFNYLRCNDMAIPEESERQPHFIFTGVYKEMIKSNLRNIGFVLHQQCNPDMPRTYFPSGYLPDAHDEDNNSMGKNCS